MPHQAVVVPPRQAILRLRYAVWRDTFPKRKLVSSALPLSQGGAKESAVGISVFFFWGGGVVHSATG